RITARRRRRRRLLRVVRHIPSRSLELHGGGRDRLLDRAATLRTFLHEGIRKFLDALKPVVALLAHIFVKWHGVLKIAQKPGVSLYSAAIAFDSRDRLERRQFANLNFSRSLNVIMRSAIFARRLA